MVIQIRGAWYLQNLPDRVVVERHDGGLAMFQLSPFRMVDETELEQYFGPHPAPYGDAVPRYIWRFYGITGA